ncbi:MAG TPA: glycosyltransferase family 1 protein [Bryobacteraceae bacterium]
MRVALDATYSIDRYPSGIAVYSGQLLSALAAEHPEDTFLHCYRPKQFWKAARAAQANVRRRVLLPSLPTFRADLFHALNQRVDKRQTHKVVSTFHDLFVMTEEYSTPDFRARFSRQARRAAENSDVIIAVSEFTARQVNSLLGVPLERIRVVPHGVEMPSACEAGPREQTILFVGALQIRKNVIRLVEAFEAMPAGWRLVLAGASTGFGAEQILQRIHSSTRRSQIEVTGYLSRRDLARLYSRASIFAFPSLGEGFGIPVLEAMANGIPVVTSNRSALAEVAGEAAWLVDPFEVVEIEHALISLIENSEMRSRFAHSGRQRAELFSWKRAVSETYAVYKELSG